MKSNPPHLILAESETARLFWTAFALRAARQSPDPSAHPRALLNARQTLAERHGDHAPRGAGNRTWRRIDALGLDRSALVSTLTVR